MNGSRGTSELAGTAITLRSPTLSHSLFFHMIERMEGANIVFCKQVRAGWKCTIPICTSTPDIVATILSIVLSNNSMPVLSTTTSPSLSHSPAFTSLCLIIWRTLFSLPCPQRVVIERYAVFHFLPFFFSPYFCSFFCFSPYPLILTTA